MPKLLDEVMQANHLFVQTDSWKKYPEACGRPARKAAIYTCMDGRLANFILPALGLQRGDAKIIRTAGNTFLDNVNDSVIISLAVAVYKLGVEEILVIGHYDCGMGKINITEMVEKMQERGIEKQTIEQVRPSLETWFGNLSCLMENIRITCRQIQMSPLLPDDIPVHGLLIHLLTGMMQVVVNGYYKDKTQLS